MLILADLQETLIPFKLIKYDVTSTIEGSSVNVYFFYVV